MDEELEDVKSDVNDLDFLSRSVILEGYEIIRNYPYDEDECRSFSYNKDEY